METIARPGLARWMFERDLRVKDAVDALGVSHMTVRRILLPFTDPARRTPDATLLGRIVAWTSGAVVAGDFYPPHLNGSAENPLPTPEQVAGAATEAGPRLARAQ